MRAYLELAEMKLDRKVLTLATADTEAGQEATKRLQALGVV